MEKGARAAAADGAVHAGLGLGGIRKNTPLGVVGAPGQAYTIYGSNWTCPSCKSLNYASRHLCTRCRTKRPAGSQSVEWSKALENAQQGKEPTWKEALDPNTRQIYYYNTVTNETSWARPEELGPAPYATGFFGRGSTGENKQEAYERQNEEWLKRPARKQSDIDPKRLQQSDVEEYNIWYHKQMGTSWKMGLGKDPAPTRCYPEHDAGYTRASLNTAEKNYFCIHFMRGACGRGQDCTYYHHIPTAKDDGRTEMTRDIFGRERFTSHRDDMQGVGSIESNSRTLYVGGLKRVEGVDLEQVLHKHFGVWGEVEHINVIHRLSIAFVRFRCRTSAEVALVAMANQALDANEVLNVRWAHDDPNPVAKESAARADADALLAAIQAKGQSLAAAPFDYPAFYALPAPAGSVFADGRILDTAAVTGSKDASGGGAGALSIASLYGSSANAYAAIPAAFGMGLQEDGEGGEAASAALDVSPDSGDRVAALYPNTDAQFDPNFVPRDPESMKPPPLASYTLPAPSETAAASTAAVSTTAATSTTVSTPAGVMDVNSPEYRQWYYYTWMMAQLQAAVAAAGSETVAPKRPADEPAAADGEGDAAGAAGAKRMRLEVEAA